MISSNNFIQELKSKNEKALDFVLDSYGNLIYKIAYMYLNSKELSEECLNDVLLKVWKNIHGYNYPNDKFKNWVASIAKNTAIDMIRREQKHSKNISDDNISLSSTENIENLHICRENLEEIKGYILNFKEIDKNIFIQHFFMDKSINEISKMYNLTPKAVNLRILRARKKLNKLIKNKEV